MSDICGGVEQIIQNRPLCFHFLALPDVPGIMPHHNWPEDIAAKLVETMLWSNHKVVVQESDG